MGNRKPQLERISFSFLLEHLQVQGWNNTEQINFLDRITQANKMQTEKKVREANFKYLFVYFSSPEIFWGLQLAINSLTFTAKAQNEQGILLFVHWKLA